MSGYPQFNFPLFDKAAARLRERGYTIVSPAELDDEETRAAALASVDGHPVSRSEQLAGHSWGDYLSRDVKLIADGVSGIILLPEWYDSRGAKLEVYVAMLCGHEVAIYNPALDVLRSRSYRYVTEVILDSISNKQEVAHG